MDMNGHEYVEDIAVTWNESYSAMRDFYDTHMVDKGEFMRRLTPLIGRAGELGEEIATLFESVEAGTLSESELTKRVREMEPEIDNIVEESGNLPFAPEDAKDYDSCAQAVFNWLDNMKLYYSERGYETWPAKNRTILMRLAIQDFRAEWQRLDYEREKLR